MAKVAIVGSGHVGSMAALFLAQKELADIVLIDIVEGLPQGTALDMSQAKPAEGFDTSIIGTNDFEAMEGSDIVVVTAGLARKPGMTRSDLLKKNAGIVKSVAQNILKYAPHSLVLIVTNPLDVMTYLAFKVLNFERSRVIGMGGV
ncbi:MAG: malate dehydrogenase, partial [Candidatus Subteraquimicrobiales bacterium]|nr:malate dehydrogenase [Candidatus Subteraquimicrobiales bacterium]